MAWLLDTAAQQNFDPDEIIGVYRSSGRRYIYLVAVPNWIDGDDYFVCISRQEPVPRFGHSEAMLARLGLSPEIIGEEEVPHVCD